MAFSNLKAQTDSINATKETTRVNKPVVKPKPTIKPKIDSVTIKNSNNNTDSTKIKDSLQQVAFADSLRKDSLKRSTAINSLQKKADTSTYTSIVGNKYFPFEGNRFFMISQLKKDNGKEILFYSLLGIVFLLALIVVAYKKYFIDVYTIFFQTAFRQRQTRDQLQQNNLPSLLMNFLFIVTGGMLTALLVSKYKLVTIDFWWIFLYASGVLAAIYLGKFIFLNFFGWLFNIKQSVETYSFIVFLLNKILGVLFVPALFILAFSAVKIANISVIILLCLVVLLFIYRYVVSLGTIRSQLKVNALHFFLYLCAVEVLPLLLIYKALFNFIKA